MYAEHAFEPLRKFARYSKAHKGSFSHRQLNIRLRELYVRWRRITYRRRRGASSGGCAAENVSSTHPAGETTIVDTLLFLVACANYSAVGRKTEKRSSAPTSQSGILWNSAEISSRDKGQGQLRKKNLRLPFESVQPCCKLNKESVSLCNFFFFLSQERCRDMRRDRPDLC